MNPRTPLSEVMVRRSTTPQRPPVHLRDHERAVRPDLLHVGDMALRRPGPDPHDHDGPDPRGTSFGIAKRPGVPPPLRRVATPGYIALVRHPPGAVAVVEPVGGAGCSSRIGDLRAGRRHPAGGAGPRDRGAGC